MKIKVHGAAGGEVTGSAYLVQTDNANILIDCGMFQGGKASEAKNKLPQGARVKDIDAVLLTHGHLDHTGRVPLLVKFGFDGPIYGTDETLELSQIILLDSARLQVADAVRKNKKFWKKGEPLAEALYTTEHVEIMQELSRAVVTNTPIEVAEGITATWIEAGHMLGSGSIKLEVIENGKKKTVVFSGDLGPVTLPFLKPFEHFDKADLVFLESTYGDRDHKPYDKTIAEFEAIILETCKAGGKMLVPSFAIGRAQQIIYHLAELFHSNRIPSFPVYLDSPMAISAFMTYRKHEDSMDEEFHALKKTGAFPLNTQYFIPTQTAASSKALNNVKGPCMII
ncbi:MAG TPA: MBL fold metallo-hydrolase, partial [Chryseolinea sp.]